MWRGRNSLRRVNWNDRGTCILFGDGAGAAVVSEVPEGYGIKGVDMGADGTGGSSRFAFLQVALL